MKNNIKENLVNNLKENLTSNLDFPEELVLNIPLITVIGRSKIIIENFKNIIEYSNQTIRINTSCGVLKIEGKDMLLKELNKTKVLIIGTLIKFEFML